MIRTTDKDFQEYHLQVKDFATAINSSSNDIFKQVDKLTEDLMSKPFKIGDENSTGVTMQDIDKVKHI